LSDQCGCGWSLIVLRSAVHFRPSLPPPQSRALESSSLSSSRPRSLSLSPIMSRPAAVVQGRAGGSGSRVSVIPPATAANASRAFTSPQRLMQPQTAAATMNPVSSHPKQQQQQQRANGKLMTVGAWSSVTAASPSSAASVSSGSGGSASSASSAADDDELRSYYHKSVSSFRSIGASAAASSRVASAPSPLRSASPLLALAAPAQRPHPPPGRQPHPPTRHRLTTMRAMRAMMSA